MEPYLKAWRKYAVFHGRACREEFWIFLLVHLIVSAAMGLVGSVAGAGGTLCMLYAIGALMPLLAVTVRRLHDTGRSGYWCLAGLFPAIGAIVLLVILALKSEEDSNRFGYTPHIA